MQRSFNVPEEVFMKYLVPILMTIVLSDRAFALGDTSVLSRETGQMTGTVGALNQVTEEEGVSRTEPQEKIMEPEEERNFSTQDIQEEIYQEQLRQEQKEWEESRNKNINLSE